MPKASADNFVSNIAAAIVGGGAVTGLALVTPAIQERIGIVLTTLLWLTVILGGAAFYIIYDRYIDLLASGGDPENSQERKAYDDLRKSLQHGGLPAQLYADRLTRFLDVVDGFFGDSSAPRSGLLRRAFWLEFSIPITVSPQRAFGLKTPAPLWTAPSFDRCLLLAFVYPFVSILLIWVISGHAGPAENALHLGGGIVLWRRLLALGLMIVTLHALNRFFFCRSFWNGVLWLIVLAVGTFGAVEIADSAVFAFSTVFCFLIPASGSAIVTLAVGVTLCMALAALIVGPMLFAAALGGVLAVLAIFASLGVFVLWVKAAKQNWQGLFLLVFLVPMLFVCLAAPAFFGSERIWIGLAPFLLFFGLLALLNAPFDWLSLGLTRALLRRGIELGEWWPYVFALLDAALAAVVVTLLAATMIVGVQAFNLMSHIGGGGSVLPLRGLLNDLAAHPSAPEFWWIYALLLSTMIPSLVNLVIGGASFVRGFPGVPALVLRHMHAGKAVSILDRNWIAFLLTFQWLAGAVLGIAAQVVLVWMILGELMPFLGFDLLGAMRVVERLNIPERIFGFFF